ncbi:MAG: cadherin-like beta sandwich domain-containing protein, partial [bacterium]|nr:cadherin-like beta sandwich domain-containing protein [bacterium]
MTGDRAEALKVELWSASSGSPGMKLADLHVPATVGSGTVRFPAPPGVQLAANTTYFVVVRADDREPLVTLVTTASGAENSGALAGWSIADTGSISPISTWSSLNGLAFGIGVNGYIPGAVPNAVALSSLTGATSTDGSSFDGTLTLDPVFDVNTRTYAAVVDAAVTQVKVTPTVVTAGATVKVGVAGTTLAGVDSG